MPQGWTPVEEPSGWTPVASDFSTSNEKDDQGSALVRGVSSFAEQVNPLPALAAVNTSLAKASQYVLAGQPVAGAKSLWQDLSATVQTVGAAQGAEWDQAASAAKRGDYATAVRHGLAYAIPIFGPMLSAQSDKAEQGDIAGMIGGSLGVAANLAAPEALKRMPSVTIPALARNVNPAERAAVQFGVREGVPLDAATVTGNPLVRGAQKIADHTSVAGSYIGRSASQAQGEGLASVAGRLADRAHPASVTAEQAGQGIRDAITARGNTLNADAGAAYDQLRAFEQQQAQTIAQHGGVPAPAAAARPFTNVPLAVDITATKAAMRPVFEALKRESELVPLMGDKGRALVALDRLMQAPDLAPLSVADAALSDLKSMARVDQAFQRTMGQGVAARAVTTLDKSVVATARQAGPPVIQALMDGRAATVNKFKAIDAFDALRTEPVKVFDQLTASKDSALNLLRQVTREAPAELPKLGRAYLEGLIQKATESGGFAHADKLYADWQRLGDGTKTILFRNPQLVKDLNDFFTLAKKIGENPNPSGSAYVGGLLAHGYLFRDPVSGIGYEIGMGALAKALHSPVLARAMVQGARVPMSTPAAAAASARILSAARVAGIPVIPAAAEAERREAR